MMSTLNSRFFLYVVFFHLSFYFVQISFADSFDYSLYKKILNENVVNFGESTKVDYANLKRKSSELIHFNKSISLVKFDDFRKWSEQEQMAFVINAYNSFTLQLIIEYYPVPSIKKIGGIFSNPWKLKFFNFLEKISSLDYLEHDILRKNYKDPRIHFALNCASNGCPPLRKIPYEGKNLNKQLEEVSSYFLQSPGFNKYDSNSNVLYLSSIFKWYADDFGSEKNLKIFIGDRMNLSSEEKENIKKSGKIYYLDYDWNLNELKR